jgi:hypothetical protein
MFVIEVGKKYLHVTGKVVTVRYTERGIYGVIDNIGRCFPAFASELQMINLHENPPVIEEYISPVVLAAEPVAKGHQTLMGSFVESWVNIVIGFTINFAANMVILPLFGFHSLTLATNFVIGLLYTVISFARSFVIRRYFNGLKWGNK